MVAKEATQPFRNLQRSVRLLGIFGLVVLLAFS